jgi:hypothetical protein
VLRHRPVAHAGGHLVQQVGHGAAEIQDGLGGRLHPRRGQDEPGGQPGGGPDECLDDPPGGSRLRRGDRQDEHRADGDLEDRVAQAQRVADEQRDHDGDPQAPPVKPTNADKPTASSTPATTAATRCTALRNVWYRLTWATSSAVSGASTGRGVTGSGSATR